VSLAECFLHALEGGSEEAAGNANLSQAESDVRKLWPHLRSGTASRGFLKAVAEHCIAKGTNEFTLDDIGFDGNEHESVKAANRNAHHGMRAAGVKVFDKRWDYGIARMRFLIHPDYVEAIRKVAAEDEEEQRSS
jgi:hypothetical protein